MPITKSTGYLDSQGVMHASIEAAQVAELQHLLSDFMSIQDEPMRHEIALFIQRNREPLLAILTTGPRSRPRARKAAGTTNPRRAIKRVTVAKPADTQPLTAASQAA